nr:MAG TPA: hypothetical protein [Caudoviricetes sp.]
MTPAVDFPPLSLSGYRKRTEKSTNTLILLCRNF